MKELIAIFFSAVYFVFSIPFTWTENLDFVGSDNIVQVKYTAEKSVTGNDGHPDISSPIVFLHKRHHHLATGKVIKAPRAICGTPPFFRFIAGDVVAPDAILLPEIHSAVTPVAATHDVLRI